MGVWIYLSRCLDRRTPRRQHRFFFPERARRDDRPAVPAARSPLWRWGESVSDRRAKRPASRPCPRYSPGEGLPRRRRTVGERPVRVPSHIVSVHSRRRRPWTPALHFRLGFLPPRDPIDPATLQEVLEVVEPDSVEDFTAEFRPHLRGKRVIESFSTDCFT